VGDGGCDVDVLHGLLPATDDIGSTGEEECAAAKGGKLCPSLLSRLVLSTL
jgi:hypothetical protein